MDRWRDDGGAGVAAFRRAATARGRAAGPGGTTVMQLEGVRLFERALAAGLRPLLALASSSLLERPGARAERLLAQLGTTDADLWRVDDSVMAELVGGRSFGDLVGLVAAPAPGSLEGIAADERRIPALVLVDVLDPGNVGALVRTAHASGVGTVVTIGCADPFHPKAVRTSMGSMFRVPVLVLPTDGWGALEQTCAAAGLPLVGLVTTRGAPIWEVDVGRRAAVVMGGEAFGLAETVASRLDGRATIPMPAGVDSFSINAATAVALYELGARRAR